MEEFFYFIVFIWVLSRQDLPGLTSSHPYGVQALSATVNNPRNLKKRDSGDLHLFLIPGVVIDFENRIKSGVYFTNTNSPQVVGLNTDNPDALESMVILSYVMTLSLSSTLTAKPSRMPLVGVIPYIDHGMAASMR